MKARAQTDVSMSYKITVELTEQEAQAMIGVFGYEVKAFLSVFYEKMGKAYLKPHEAGLISIKDNLLPELSRAVYKIEQTRNYLKKQHEKVSQESTNPAENQQS